MPYDKEMEEKVKTLFADQRDLTFKPMFGGICYLYKGNMAFGLYKDNLIVRIGAPEEAERAIAFGQAIPFDITGKTMRGWIMVPKARLATIRDYKRWLEKGLTYAKSLSPK
jgi:TfoX/Sxy family transcriptional regulator of competence genes